MDNNKSDLIQTNISSSGNGQKMKIPKLNLNAVFNDSMKPKTLRHCHKPSKSLTNLIYDLPEQHSRDTRAKVALNIPKAQTMSSY